MTRFEFWFWPFLLAGLAAGALTCYAFGFNPFRWLLAQAHQFAIELGGNL